MLSWLLLVGVAVFGSTAVWWCPFLRAHKCGIFFIPM